MLNTGELVQSLLWLDALPVTNQQESLTGPHPFSNHQDSQTWEGASFPLH